MVPAIIAGGIMAASALGNYLNQKEKNENTQAMYDDLTDSVNATNAANPKRASNPKQTYNTTSPSTPNTKSTTETTTTKMSRAKMMERKGWFENILR